VQETCPMFLCSDTWAKSNSHQCKCNSDIYHYAIMPLPYDTYTNKIKTAKNNPLLHTVLKKTEKHSRVVH